MKMTTLKKLATTLILLVPAYAHSARYLDMTALTQNPPEELKKLGLTVFKDNQFKHHISAPFLDSSGQVITISSGEKGVGISQITVNGDQIEITYENGVIDNLVMDERAGTYKVVTQTTDKKVLPALTGRILRGQNCKLSANQIKVGERSFPFELERLGGLGSKNAEFRELFAGGVCAPLDCEYDATQKATFVGGVMLSEKMSFHTHAVGNYAAWQKAGVCKKVDMKCSFTTLPDSGKIHVKALGVALGTPIEDWQGFDDQVRNAREFYGCTFSKVDCALSGTGAGAIDAVAALGGGPGLRIGTAVIPASMPAAPGIPGAKGLAGVVAQLGRLKGVCEATCRIKQNGGSTTANINGSVVTYANEQGFTPASECGPLDENARTDRGRKDLRDDSGAPSSGNAVGPAGSEARGAK